MIGKWLARSDDPRWKPWKVAVAAVAIKRVIVFTVGYAANSPAGRLFYVRAGQAEVLFLHDVGGFTLLLTTYFRHREV